MHLYSSYHYYKSRFSKFQLSKFLLIYFSFNWEFYVVFFLTYLRLYFFLYYALPYLVDVCFLVETHENDCNVFFCVLKVPHPERINKYGQLSYGPLREGSQVCPVSQIGVFVPLPFPLYDWIFCSLYPFEIFFYFSIVLPSYCSNSWPTFIANSCCVANQNESNIMHWCNYAVSTLIDVYP